MYSRGRNGDGSCVVLGCSLWFLKSFGGCYLSHSWMILGDTSGIIKGVDGSSKPAIVHLFRCCGRWALSQRDCQGLRCLSIDLHKALAIWPWSLQELDIHLPTSKAASFHMIHDCCAVETEEHYALVTSETLIFKNALRWSCSHLNCTMAELSVHDAKSLYLARKDCLVGGKIFLIHTLVKFVFWQDSCL